ncbi:SH3 and multiple ankyrin repeat domains protein 1-like [Hetaerina americana]|uniref:SH3 and multiple ankyrin repeat domains protein 1-like n=1 Tax=Hetaerina americana TaxID=62018 RepID=UPI003A7F5A1C
MAATTTTQSPTPGGSLHWPIGHGGHHGHQHHAAAPPHHHHHHHHRFTIAAQPRGLSPPSSPMVTSVPSPGSRTKAPLRTINRGPSFLRSSGRAANAKRKSAVELLAESKAFYVKSEKVLDSKQELRNSGHLQVAPSSAAHTLSGLLSSAARPIAPPKPPSQSSSSTAANPGGLPCCGPRPGMGCQGQRIKGGGGCMGPACGGPQPPGSFSPPSPPRSSQPGTTTAMLTMVMISSEQGGRGFPSTRTPSPPSSPPPVLPPKSPRLSSSAPSGEGRGSAVYYPTAPFPAAHCTRRARAGDGISGSANRRSQPGSSGHSEDVTMQLRRLLLPTVSREEEEEAARRSAAAEEREAEERSRRRRHIPDEVFRQSSGEWVEEDPGWGMGPMPTIPPPRRYSGGGGSGSGGGGGGSSGGRCHCCNGRGEAGSGSRVRQRSTPSEKGLVQARPAPPVDSDEDSLDNNSDDDMGMAVQRRRLSARVSPPPRHRPILRSKSDISHRYSRPANAGNNSPYPPAPSSSSAPGPDLPVTPLRRRPLPPPPPIQQISLQQHCYSPPPPPMTPRSSTDLERFFDRLGLGGENSSPSAPSSPCPSSPPVFFDSVSSVDSWPGNVGMPRESGESGGGIGGRWREAVPPGSEPSIVERNARIIKWLCNCRKAQLGGGGGGVGTSR